MCIIFSAIGNSIDPKKYKEALDLMNHRGSDFTGEFYNSEVYLGHKRLSILDLNPRSNQPFATGEYKMVFNGEIYNYKELIAAHGLTVHTEPDTEVLLQMYIKYGAKCLNFLNGMFAFVIYNTTSQEYFIARDRSSNSFLLNKLNPCTLNVLIAAFEHKIFVQGVVLNSSSFDPWGCGIRQAIGWGNIA